MTYSLNYYQTCQTVTKTVATKIDRSPLSFVLWSFLGHLPQARDPAQPNYRTIFSAPKTRDRLQQNTIDQPTTSTRNSSNSTSSNSFIVRFFSIFFSRVLWIPILISTSFATLYWGPGLLYQVSLIVDGKQIKQTVSEEQLTNIRNNSQHSATDSAELAELADSPDSPDSEQSNQVNHLPPVDPSLPQTSTIIIPKIEVETELRMTNRAEEALDVGVWWVPNFGTPGENELPMIVAAHRFGFAWWWQDGYWRRNSFYRLPELVPGDQVTIIHQQRKWHYEIYDQEEGHEITDYEADLILYTCKHLNSPIRIIKYARLSEQDHLVED